jgi:phage baseplate assembly protein V
MNERDVDKMLGPTKRRLQNMVARGTVSRSDAARLMQGLQIQLLAGETLDGIEHFEPYGYTSRPKPGAEVLTIFVDGDRSHGIVLVAADRRYRMTAFEEGEVAIHDDQGQSVHLTRTGIVVKGGGLPIKITDTPSVTVEADTSVTLDTPLVHCTHDLKVDGLLTTLNFTMLTGGAANWGAGGTGTMNFNNMTVTYTGGSIRHNGHRIDDQLRVTGITAGGANSGTPV